MPSFGVWRNKFMGVVLEKREEGMTHNPIIYYVVALHISVYSSGGKESILP